MALMYRTIKSTDKPAASSGRFKAKDSRKTPNPLVENRQEWMQVNSNGITSAELRSTSLSSQIEDGYCRSSSTDDSCQEHQIPSLEFTLGRSDWHSKYIIILLPVPIDGLCNQDGIRCDVSGNDIDKR
ncbi:hypothetical protein C4D60_Mb11t10870 [Musa balbisiana]|uniref:Uncharacterized protein n=1 Tax=Musa balbisiana TaxID=52838 RepID=A0A4S8J443_MUSBA|nr:hypothetical protein C4D60_Mb11t10870 [Musa balbisiana]